MNRQIPDTDLLILERALGGKIPENEAQDWQLPHHFRFPKRTGKLAGWSDESLPLNRSLQTCCLKAIVIVHKVKKSRVEFNV